MKHSKREDKLIRFELYITVSSSARLSVGPSVHPSISCRASAAAAAAAAATAAAD